MNLLVNIDVDDLEQATRFYCDGLGLAIGRRFDGWIELIGAAAPIYLLPKNEGTPISPVAKQKRDYKRHWTPVHLDFVVDDIEVAVRRAEAAGARLEKPIATQAWGKLALMADPFGHGFCFVQFVGGGYDEVAE